MYQRGDIVLVPFPFTGLSSNKKRPALIISNDEVHVTGDFIVVMITSQDKQDILQIEIEDGDLSIVLPKKSFIRCHKITTIDSKIILGLISKVNDNLLQSVEEKINSLIGKSGGKMEI